MTLPPLISRSYKITSLSPCEEWGAGSAPRGAEPASRELPMVMSASRLVIIAKLFLGENSTSLSFRGAVGNEESRNGPIFQSQIPRCARHDTILKRAWATHSKLRSPCWAAAGIIKQIYQLSNSSKATPLGASVTDTSVERPPATRLLSGGGSSAACCNSWICFTEGYWGLPID